MFYTLTRQSMEKNRQMYTQMLDASHPLIALDQLINWSGLLKMTIPYYAKTSTGRPTADPIVLIKILFIQKLEGFRSVRFTCKQIQSNATYRWFLGISLFTRVPNHSTISKFLWQRLQGADFWLTVFNQQIHQVYKEGFIANETWAGDETELKADANKRHRHKILTEKVMQTKQEDLQEINAFRVKHGKKPLKVTPPKIIYHPTNYSPIDQDARLSVKHVERGQFAYFEHRIVDTLHGFIIATELTAANVPGHQVLPTQVDQLKRIFGEYAKEMTLDAAIIMRLVPSN